MIYHWNKIETFFSYGSSETLLCDKALFKFEYKKPKL